MLDAKIVVPLRYSKCIANLVLVRNNNGEIRPCVDFRNLNKLLFKDNYPLLKMDQFIKRVTGSKYNRFWSVKKMEKRQHSQLHGVL